MELDARRNLICLAGVILRTSLWFRLQLPLFEFQSMANTEAAEIRSDFSCSSAKSIFFALSRIFHLGFTFLAVVESYGTLGYCL